MILSSIKILFVNSHHFKCTAEINFSKKMKSMQPFKLNDHFSIISRLDSGEFCYCFWRTRDKELLFQDFENTIHRNDENTFRYVVWHKWFKLYLTFQPGRGRHNVIYCSWQVDSLLHSYVYNHKISNLLRSRIYYYCLCIWLSRIFF